MVVRGVGLKILALRTGDVTILVMLALASSSRGKKLCGKKESPLTQGHLCLVFGVAPFTHKCAGNADSREYEWCITGPNIGLIFIVNPSDDMRFFD